MRKCTEHLNKFTFYTFTFTISIDTLNFKFSTSILQKVMEILINLSIIRTFTGLRIYSQKSNFNLFKLGTSDIVMIGTLLMELLHVISIPFTLAYAKKYTVDRFKTVQKPRRIAVLLGIIVLFILRIVFIIVCKLSNICLFRK